MIGALTQRFKWGPRQALDLDDLELAWWIARAQALSEAERAAVERR